MSDEMAGASDIPSEAVALFVCVEAMKGLDTETQTRIVQYLEARLKPSLRGLLSDALETRRTYDEMITRLERERRLAEMTVRKPRPAEQPNNG